MGRKNGRATTNRFNRILVNKMARNPPVSAFEKLANATAIANGLLITKEDFKNARALGFNPTIKKDSK